MKEAINRRQGTKNVSKYDSNIPIKLTTWPERTIYIS